VTRNENCRERRRPRDGGEKKEQKREREREIDR